QIFWRGHDDRLDARIGHGADLRRLLDALLGATGSSISATKKGRQPAAKATATAKSAAAKATTAKSAAATAGTTTTGAAELDGRLAAGGAGAGENAAQLVGHIN